MGEGSEQPRGEEERDGDKVGRSDWSLRQVWASGRESRCGRESWPAEVGTTAGWRRGAVLRGDHGDNSNELLGMNWMSETIRSRRGGPAAMSTFADNSTVLS